MNQKLKIKDIKFNDVLVHTGHFCMSHKRELRVNIVTEKRIMAEDKTGAEKLYNEEQLSDYILKKE